MRLGATSTESSYSAPKRLAAPVSTTVKKPNLLAQAYNYLLSRPGSQISSPVNTGRGVSMGGQGNALQVAVEPVRQATRRAVGDFTAIPGIGRPSPSPTAADVKRGNYLNPALDYVTLATTVIPAVKAVRNRPVYGVHSSPVEGLTEIKPRVTGQIQRTASDAVPGSSYMWDAKSPYVQKGQVLDNYQMRLRQNPDMFFDDEVLNTLYLTKAPRRTIIADANVPNSPSLRVIGPQKVVGTLPLEKEALRQALRSYGVNPRSAYIDDLVQKARTLSPRFRASVTQRYSDLAEERLRSAIQQSAGPNKPPAFWGEVHGLGLDPNAPLDELLANPTARDIFDEFVRRFAESGTAMR